MQKARRHPKAPTACKRTVSGTISLPCSGYFSPFPHGTCSLSVSQEYLALPDGSGRFRQDYTCPALLRILLGIKILRIRDYHPLWSYFPKGSTSILKSILQSYNPNNAETMLVWANSRSFATTREITNCFLLLQVLRCFSSLGLPHRSGNWSSTSWVSPFRNLWIKGYLLLPKAYRSLSRLSSPLRAKASAMRP